ncbi:MAG: hypothetical protein NT007_19060 [Candidatus Kapabacteria bacterium]|nr:hypothetical protein [Candidatus Kapabacteria bacterium]
MNTIFISSRMSELATAREIAFTTCKYLGYRPLMFETEPIEELKEKIDKLIESSDSFLGLFYKTIGLRSSKLYNLAPIEYELAFFIRNKCKKKCNKYEKECILHVRDLTTAHFKNNSIHTECMETIENNKNNIHIFCKAFDDEHSITSPLHLLIDGLIRIGLEHIDFEDDWDLSNKLVNDLNEEMAPKLTSYLVKYESKNKKGLLNAFTDLAFFNNLNIDKLFVYTKDDRTVTVVKLTDYSPNNKSSDDNINNFKRSLKEKREDNKLMFESLQGEQIDLKPKIFNDNTKIKLEIEMNEIEYEIFNIDRETYEVDRRFIIRVYHLDVPGIIFNLTEVLNRSKIFDIEQCVVKNFPEKDYWFNHKKPSSIKDLSDTKNIKLIKFNYYNQKKIQVTDMIVKYDRTYELTNKSAIILQNALNKIIGVIRVLISEKEIELVDPDE